MVDILKDSAVELICFGIGTGLGITFYSFLKTGKNIIKSIEEIPEICLDKNLPNLLKKHGSLEACITGSVVSDELPIHSVQHPHITGVIWKYTIKEHIIAQMMGIWTNDKKTIDETMRTISFSLLNNGTRVKVNFGICEWVHGNINGEIANSSNFDSVDLSVVSEKFVSANNSLADHLWGFVRGVRSTGTQYTEEMLVEGTRVLAFGKLVVDKGVLLKPHSTIPYILTTKDKQGIVEEFEDSLNVFRILVAISSGIALYCSYRLGEKFYNKWKEFKKKKEELNVLNEIREQRSARDFEIPENLMCLVCCGLRDVLIMPCKHICICGECYLKLDPKICPVCRTPVESIQPVFYS